MKTVRRAFTLVELLVVIAILGLLLALTMPALKKARMEARHLQCVGNLRGIGFAFINYKDANKDRFSPSTGNHIDNGLPGNTYTSYRQRYYYGRKNRSTAKYYKHGYIEDAKILESPFSRRKNPQLYESWKEAEEYACSEQPYNNNMYTPFWGSYFLLQNYIGNKGCQKPYEGPKSSTQRGENVLAADYFIRWSWPVEKGYMSNTPFYSGGGGGVVKRTALSTDCFYILRGRYPRDSIKIKLHAVLRDGSVISYGASDTMGVWVAKDRWGNKPYSQKYGEQLFPKNDR